MDHTTRRKRWRLRLLAAALLCALALAAKARYPQAAQALAPWLVGRADNRVTTAFAALGSALEQGDGLGRAAAAFCAEMSGDGLS